MSGSGRNFKPLTLIICIYVMLVATFAIWSYYSEKQSLLKTIDDKLLFVASNIKRILPEDFHDRAVDKDSISKEEDVKIGTTLSDYVNTTGIIYAYTMIRKDGNIYFTSSSNTLEEIARGDISTYFLPYEEASDATVKAFDKTTVIFNTDSDRWGAFRSALIPEHSPKGNLYISGSDIDVREVNKKLKSIFWRALIISGIFIVLAIPFILAHTHSTKERIEEFESLRDMLHQKSMQRTTRIDKKIEEYIKKK
jgi:hypothetical protein